MRTSTRILLGGLAACALGWVLAGSAGLVHLAEPVDRLLNLAPAIGAGDLRAGPDEVVVLIHGLARGPRSLDRLRRGLEGAGYEVWSFGYDGGWHGVERIAADLDAFVRERLDSRTAPPRRLHAAAHSLGGLVLRQWQRRADAPRVDRAVCLGSPHRGARMASLFDEGWLYRVVMGRYAALELRPESSFLRGLPLELSFELGNVIGARGDGIGWSTALVGDDDGRVAVGEAHLPGERDAIELRVGHTGMCTADEVHRQVLHFLARGRFERSGS